MILHPLQLPTGQGHLKIKSVLPWQQFLAGQSPTYHEVVRWLAPSLGYPWVSEDRPLSVLRVEVALGLCQVVDRDIVWPCLSTWHSHGASWGLGVGPGLSRVGCVTDRRTGKWQTKLGHLFSRMFLCVSLLS